MNAWRDECDYHCIMLKPGQELRVGADISCDLPVSMPKLPFSFSRHVPPTGRDVARVCCSLDGKIFLTILTRMVYVYANGFRLTAHDVPVHVKPGCPLSFGDLCASATYRFFTTDTRPVLRQPLLPCDNSSAGCLELPPSSSGASSLRKFQHQREKTAVALDDRSGAGTPHETASSQHPVVPYVVEVWSGRAMLHSVFQQDYFGATGAGQSYDLKGTAMSGSETFADPYMTFNGRFLLKNHCSFCYETPVQSAAASVLDSIDSAYNLQDDSFLELTEDSKKLFMKHFLVLYEHAISLLAAAPLTVRSCSPIVCCGDIHGSFADLKFIVDNVVPFRHWSLMTTPVMFLGDYVDRGPHDVEVILYLLAWYVLCPENVILLRGNHEDEEVNGDVGYYGESSFLSKCIKFFGKEDGELFWKRVNDVFENLPVLAIIDETFLACHGGIPFLRGKRNSENMEDLSKGGVRKSLSHKDPLIYDDIPHEELLELLLNGASNEFSDVRFRRLMPVATDNNLTAQRRRLVRELLWNDPVGHDLSSQPQSQSKSLSQKCDTSLSQSFEEHNFDASNTFSQSFYGGFNEYGFRDNVGRGVEGDVIREFTMSALDAFLQRWGFTLLIRAHQQKVAGVEMGLAGRVLTLFSCSNYTGDINRAGACVIANKKVRPVSWQRFAEPETTTTREVQEPARCAIANFDLLVDSFCSTFDSNKKLHQAPLKTKPDTVRVG